MENIVLKQKAFFVFSVFFGALGLVFFLFLSAGAQQDIPCKPECSNSYVSCLNSQYLIPKKDDGLEGCRKIHWKCTDVCADMKAPLEEQMACIRRCSIDSEACNEEVKARAQDEGQALYDAACNSSASPSQSQTTQPPTSVIQEKKARLTDELPSSIIFDGKEYAKALVEQSPSDGDFPEDDLTEEEKQISEGSDEQWLMGTPYGPFVGRGLKEKGIKVEYRITFTKLENGQPEIILPDGKKLDYTYMSWDSLREVPDGTKIVTPPGVKIRMRLRMDQLPESAVNLPHTPEGAPIPAIRGRYVSVDVGENSELEVKEIYRGFVKIKVNKGYARFKRRAPIPLGPASETGVMLGAKGTDFAIAYDPLTKQTIAEIYDGVIEVIDLQNEKTLTTLSASYGGLINRAEVAQDKTFVEKIAVSQSEWSAFVSKLIKHQQENPSDSQASKKWIWILVAILIATGAGYFIYLKRSALMEVLAKVLKKEPKQPL